MRLFPHVYLLAGSVYGVHQNVYAIRTKHSVILVDTGKNEHELEVIHANLSYWGLDQLPISAVLLTHEHYEHVANAYAFQACGAELIATGPTAAALAAGDHRTAGYAHPFEAPLPVIRVDRQVADAQTFTVDGQAFLCHAIPGHSAGSAAYQTVVDGKTLLFTGDTIIPSRLCLTCDTGWTGAVDYDRLTLLDSIAKLSMLQTDALLAGHGEICLREGQQLLHEAIVKARQSLKHVPVYEPFAKEG